MAIPENTEKNRESMEEKTKSYEEDMLFAYITLLRHELLLTGFEKRVEALEKKEKKK